MRLRSFWILQTSITSLMLLKKSLLMPPVSGASLLLHTMQWMISSLPIDSMNLTKSWAWNFSMHSTTTSTQVRSKLTNHRLNCQFSIRLHFIRHRWYKRIQQHLELLLYSSYHCSIPLQHILHWLWHSSRQQLRLTMVSINDFCIS